MLKLPGCSPDLSPVENIWCIMMQKLRQRRPNCGAAQFKQKKLNFSHLLHVVLFLNQIYVFNYLQKIALCFYLDFRFWGWLFLWNPTWVSLHSWFVARGEWWRRKWCGPPTQSIYWFCVRTTEPAWSSTSAVLAVDSSAERWGETKLCHSVETLRPSVCC